MCYSHFLEHRDTVRGGRDICLGVLIWEAIVEIPVLVPLVSMQGQKGHYSPLAMTPLAPKLPHIELCFLRAANVHG